MKQYRLFQKDNKHWFREIETDFCFGPYNTKEVARKKMQFMNGGGGFNGYTPKFMRNLFGDDNRA